jgi:hypothetical protein
MDKLERQIFGLAFGIGIFLPFLQYFFWQMEKTGDVFFKQQDVSVSVGYSTILSLCLWVFLEGRKAKDGRDLSQDKSPESGDPEHTARNQEQRVN